MAACIFVVFTEAAEMCAEINIFHGMASLYFQIQRNYSRNSLYNLSMAEATYFTTF